MSHIYQLSGDSISLIHSDKPLGLGDIIHLGWGNVEVTSKYPEGKVTHLRVEEYTPQAAASVVKLKKISDAPYYLTLSAGYKIVHGSNEIMLAEDKKMREVLYLMSRMWPDIEYYHHDGRTITLY